jgi:hypothetical protein
LIASDNNIRITENDNIKDGKITKHFEGQSKTDDEEDYSNIKLNLSVSPVNKLQLKKRKSGIPRTQKQKELINID